jgi:hypothetical protein
MDESPFPEMVFQLLHSTRERKILFFTMLVGMKRYFFGKIRQISPDHPHFFVLSVFHVESVNTIPLFSVFGKLIEESAFVVHSGARCALAKGSPMR